MTLYTTFRNIWYTFTPYKLKINTFSGSANLWRLLGEYEHLNLLLWYYKRPFCGLRCPKMGQNDQLYDFWVHFVHFHAIKVRN